MKLAATIVGQATDEIIAKGRRIASFLLETGEVDIEFAHGRYRVAGTDREIGIFDVAAAAGREDLPPDLQGPLAGICDQTLPVASFPYGTQVCEVEVDPETGTVEIVGYAAVDDVGRAVNPLILHGQTHGGIAQGVGQALLEDSHYDRAERAIAGGELYGLRDAARRDLAVFSHGAQRSAVADQPARRPVRRRGRHDAGAGRGDQRDRRRARRIRGAPYRNAGNARAGMARHPGSARCWPRVRL